MNTATKIMQTKIRPLESLLNSRKRTIVSATQAGKAFKSLQKDKKQKDETKN